MGTNSYTYAYDPIGNRLQSAVAAGSGPSGETLYTANALNQSPITYQSNSLQPNSLSPSYDHQSRRIRKEVSAYNASTSNFEPVTCNLFLYDGWNVIRETISNQQSAITNYYTWGADLSGTLKGAGGVGGLLAVTTCNSQPVTCNTYYPLFDANGNITAYLDSTGAVVARFEYDAFGNTISETLSNVSTLELSNFPIRFSTKYLDDETGMYYYGYRFYSPELGRWINRDPIEERGSVNLYCATRNSAINVIDYLGHKDYAGWKGKTDKGANCAGYALTGDFPVNIQLPSNQNLYEYFKSKRWSVRRIDKVEDCTCACDEIKAIVVVYKYDQKSYGPNEVKYAKDPSDSDNDQFTRGYMWDQKTTDYHCYRAEFGDCDEWKCVSKLYTEQEIRDRKGTPEEVKPIEEHPSKWVDGTRPALCLCKLRL